MTRTLRWLVPALVAALTPVSALAANYDDDPHPEPVQPVQTGQKRSGFTLGISLQSQVLSITSQTEAFFFNGLQGGFFAGYKVDRFMFGLSLAVSRAASGSSTTIANTNSDSSSASTALVVLPGVRVALVRSTDRKVELFGQFDIGWGRLFREQDPAPQNTSSDASNNRLVYDLGPGVRYWIHPQFALSALAAVRGDFTWETTTSTTGGIRSSITRSTGTTGILGGLEFLGVF